MKTFLLVNTKFFGFAPVEWDDTKSEQLYGVIEDDMQDFLVILKNKYPQLEWSKD